MTVSPVASRATRGLDDPLHAADDARGERARGRGAQQRLAPGLAIGGTAIKHPDGRGRNTKWGMMSGV